MIEHVVLAQSLITAEQQRFRGVCQDPEHAYQPNHLPRLEQENRPENVRQDLGYDS